jgi:hypothetical protein
MYNHPYLHQLASNALLAEKVNVVMSNKPDPAVVAKQAQDRIITTDRDKKEWKVIQERNQECPVCTKSFSNLRAGIRHTLGDKACHNTVCCNCVYQMLDTTGNRCPFCRGTMVFDTEEFFNLWEFRGVYRCIHAISKVLKTEAQFERWILQHEELKSYMVALKLARNRVTSAEVRDAVYIPNSVIDKWYKMKIYDFDIRLPFEKHILMAWNTVLNQPLISSEIDEQDDDAVAQQDLSVIFDTPVPESKKSKKRQQPDDGDNDDDDYKQPPAKKQKE